MGVVQTYPRAIAGRDSMLLTPSWNESGAGLKGIIALHGHGNDCKFVMMGGAFEPHPWRLAQSGFAVLCIDRGDSWWNGDATVDSSTASGMGAINAAYNDLINTVGVAGTKVGLIGQSMGGGAGLQFIKQRPTYVACAYFVNPATDLDFFHQTAGYTPAYSILGNTYAGAYVAEIDAAYGGNYAVNAVGHKIRDEYSTWHGLGIPITIAQASDDVTVPPAASTAFVNGVNDANVTLRAGSLTGGHLGAEANIDWTEIRDFFQAHA